MKIFILLNAILLCIAGNSQNVATNKEPLVANTGGCVLYRGIDNYLTISAGRYDSVQIQIRNGTIKHVHGGMYNVVPRPDTTATIITLKTPAKSFEFIYQLKNVPDPELYVAGASYSEGVITTLRLSNAVSATLNNFCYNALFRVESFWISFSGGGFDSTTVHVNQGAAWDNMTKELLNKCRAGSYVLIENVAVTGPDGHRRYLDQKLSCLFR